MGFKDIMDKIARMKANRKNPRDGLADDETSDKFLRSLRRERRVQMEEVEKATLKKKIAAFNKEKTSQELFGFKGPMKKTGIGRLQEKEEA